MRGLTLLALALAAAAQPVIRKPAQPGHYLESAGKRAALLGHEDGTFEAWIYPIKLLRDFHLSVSVDDSLDPTPLAPLAESVQVKAGSATITHIHPAFTIRQTWAASIHRPSAVVVLDIDTSRPLVVRASFIPEMKPMWPASFGGQSTGWDQANGILTFGEGLGRFHPVLGSPLFERISEQVGHQLPDRMVAIEFHVKASGTVPIVLAGSRAEYDEALLNAALLPEWAESHYKKFLHRTTKIEALGLTAAYDFARLAIERGWACPENVGCGLVAGWAPSALSERPGFGWFFGGDTMMSAWAMADYGDFTGAAAALEFLLARQRDDGKIMHEWTQSAALLDWSKYPYGYYHADTTPLLLFTAADYLRHSGDREFLDRHWPQFVKAYRFCLTIADDDGLLSNRKGGAAAVETGALSGKVARDVYLQGVWLAGLQGFLDMARWKQEPALAEEAGQRLAKARAAIKSWFVPEKNVFAFAQLEDGSRYEANSGWQAFLLAHGGIDPTLAAKATASLALPTLATPWGTRLFATDSPFYNPLGYNDGSVWPFVTAQAALAMFFHAQPAAGFRYLYGMAQATGLTGAGFLAEYFSGDRFAEGPRAVPHQLFSSVAMIHPLLSGMLGLEPDAFAHRLTIDPHIPCDLGPVRFDNYRIGESQVSGTINPDRPSSIIELRSQGPMLLITRKDSPCFDLSPLDPLVPGQRGR